MLGLFLFFGAFTLGIHCIIQRENRYKSVFLISEMRFEDEEVEKNEGQDAGLSFSEILKFGSEVKNEALGIFLALFVYCLIIPGLVLSCPVTLNIKSISQKKILCL